MLHDELKARMDVNELIFPGIFSKLNFAVEKESSYILRVSA